MNAEEKQHRRAHRNFWCWLFGCYVIMVNGDHWCQRCDRDRYFEKGKIR